PELLALPRLDGRGPSAWAPGHARALKVRTSKCTSIDIDDHTIRIDIREGGPGQRRIAVLTIHAADNSVCWRGVAGDGDGLVCVVVGRGAPPVMLFAGAVLLRQEGFADEGDALMLASDAQVRDMQWVIENLERGWSVSVRR